MTVARAKLHDTQVQVIKDTHRFRVICAGRRWGKSVLSQLIVLRWAIDNVGTYWIVSPTYRQGKQIHWRALNQIVPKDWVQKKNEVELSITLRNGSIIELKGAENPDALRGVKLRGLVIDEIASIRNWDSLWHEVLRQTLVDYKAPAIFISTPKGYNHFYELFQQGQASVRDVVGESDYKSWRFTSYDNPYIPKEEIDNAKKELAEDTFYQEYMADFRKYTGLVYKEFDRQIHVQELPDFRPIFTIRGLDRGFTNPTAVPIVQVDADGTWYQTHELHQAQLTNVVLNTRLNELSDQAGVTGYELSTMDAAAAGDIQELNDLGQDFISVRKESGEAKENYVAWKIQKFAARLRLTNGRPRYFVHPRCEKTIYEFERYQWPEKVTDINQPEAPIKADDHMMDALADLNAMYMHDYEPKKLKPWANKIPGTYIPPSMPDEDENEWSVPAVSWGGDDL